MFSAIELLGSMSSVGVLLLLDVNRVHREWCGKTGGQAAEAGCDVLTPEIISHR